MEAVSSGELGEVDDFGVVISLKQFKEFFKDVKSDYINSFLPAAVIEIGQHSMTHTKYLFRVRKGLYRIHPDAIDEHNSSVSESDYIENLSLTHTSSKVKESRAGYQIHRV